MAHLVIVPTYNERANLGPLARAVLAQGRAFHLLIVDDNSPDGTGQVADQLGEEFPGRVAVIHRQGKLGLATAYLAGFRYGVTHGYDTLFEMDADGSHDPGYLPEFLEVLRREGADVVLGSRYVPGGGTKGWTPVRRLVSRWGSRYARAILGLPFCDLTGGYKAFRRTVLEPLNLDAIQCSGYGFQIEVTYRLFQQGARIVEMPIMFRDRRHGRSKMDAGIFLEAMLTVPRLRLETVEPRVVEAEKPRV